MKKTLTVVLSLGLTFGPGWNLAHANKPVSKGSFLGNLKVGEPIRSTLNGIKPSVGFKTLEPRGLALPPSNISPNLVFRVVASLRKGMKPAIGPSSPAHARTLAEQGLSAGVERAEQATDQVAKVQAESDSVTAAATPSEEAIHMASGNVFTRSRFYQKLMAGVLAVGMVCGISGCTGGSVNTLPSRRPSATVLLDNTFQTTPGAVNYLNDQYHPVLNPRGALYSDEAAAALVMETNDLYPLHVGVPGLLDYIPATQIRFGHAYRESFESALDYVNSIPSDLAALAKVFYNGYDWTIIYPTNLSSFPYPDYTWDLATTDIYRVQDYLNYGTTAEEAYGAIITDDGYFYYAGSPIYPSRDLSASPIFYDPYKFPSFYALTSWLASNPDLDDFLILGTKPLYDWADGTVTAFVPFDVDLLAASLKLDRKSLAASIKIHTEQIPTLGALQDRAQRIKGSRSEQLASKAIASATRKGGALERSVRAGKSPFSQVTRAATRPVVHWDRVFRNHGISISRERGIIEGLQRPGGNRFSSRFQRAQRERQNR